MVEISYHVNKELYFSSGTEHLVLLTTTEYMHKNEVIVHLLIGGGVNERINDMFNDWLPGGSDVAEEQFFQKNLFGDLDKVITKKDFIDILKSFEMEQTVIEREILEEYPYVDKKGNFNSVQVVIIVNGGEMKATIDFADSEQYNNFSCPMWLSEAPDSNG